MTVPVLALDTLALATTGLARPTVLAYLGPAVP